MSAKVKCESKLTEVMERL